MDKKICSRSTNGSFGVVRNRKTEMGKASKWIRNYLMGKREEKFKMIDAFYTENKIGNMVSQKESPKVKRRWSFGKIAGGRITGKVEVHKYSRSSNSGDSAQLQIQAMLETQAPKSLATALAEVSIDIEFETAAATKIQAAFRSYLARKALHALRGLVKIQALVRGHLVRKQTTATLRGMHALMAIQVRARIQRMQMVEEANLLLGKQSPQHRENPQYETLIRENKDSKAMSLKEMLEVLKSRSGPLDRSHVKSTKNDSMTFYSKHLSVSKRKHEYMENTLITAPNSPENFHTISEFNPTSMGFSTSQRHPLSFGQSWEPNYMTKTESSRAKARSQSEPKQRPKRGMRHKSKPVESTKELITSLNASRQNLSSNSSRFDRGSLGHLVFSLYGSVKDSKCIPLAAARRQVKEIFCNCN